MSDPAPINEPDQPKTGLSEAQKAKFDALMAALDVEPDKWSDLQVTLPIVGKMPVATTETGKKVANFAQGVTDNIMGMATDMFLSSVAKEEPQNDKERKF